MRNCLVANCATCLAVMAFVQVGPDPHKERAFQASSPKTFKARPRAGLFFCPTIAAVMACILRTGLPGAVRAQCAASNRCEQSIANCATGLAVMAFAGISPGPHKEQAFQASSPKTFKARPRAGLFFCPTIAAVMACILRTGLPGAVRAQCAASNRCEQSIANCATGLAVMAFAGISPGPHKEQAFQASSPKTFKARPRAGLFFCPAHW